MPTNRHQFIARQWPGIVLLFWLVFLWWISGLQRPVGHWEREIQRVHELGIKTNAAVSFNPETHEVKSGVKEGWLETRGPEISGIQFVQWKVQLDSPVELRNIRLQFFGPGDLESDFDSELIHHRTRRPQYHFDGKAYWLTWNLPRPAMALRWLLPSNSRLQIQSIRMTGLDEQSADRENRMFLLKLAGAGIGIGLLLLWISCLRPGHFPRIPEQSWMSVLVVGLMGGQMIWLLPPFQGPDENRHWKAAVAKFRSDGQPGNVLHDLPDLLQAEFPRWRSENAFRGDLLVGMWKRPIELAEQESVGYAGPWAYPIVGLVSLFAPAVHTLPEALTFYFACRIVALGILCLLLLLVQRWLGTSWLLTMFLISPLVLQQFFIVSTDTVVNLGTLASLWLFAWLRQQPSLGVWISLALVSVVVVIAKPPIYAVLLVLPAWFLPWRRLLSVGGFFIAGAILVAILVGGYLALWKILDQADSSLANQAREQLQYVLTSEGIQQFLWAASEYPYRCAQLRSWCEPLGWLDTDLSPTHLSLIGLSFALALLLDGLNHGGAIGRALVARYFAIAGGVGLVLLFGACAWLSLALIMYLTISPLQADYIVGMQVRYMIPVALLALLLPRILASPSRGAGPVGRQPPVTAWNGPLVHALGLIVLSMLLTTFAARMVQLATDLMYRYWS